MEPLESEVLKLRRALGDMAALSSLPALWLNADAQRVAESLAEALMRVLEVDAVRVVLSGPDQSLEVERRTEAYSGDLAGPLKRAFPAGQGAFGDALQLEDGARALCLGLGLTAESRLYAVARRPGFPSAAERLALVMASNQAAIALQNAATQQALRAQTEALNRERDAVAALNRSIVSERDRLRLLFDQAPGFMAMLRGPDHVLELCNQSYYRLVGRRHVLGRPVRDAFPELEGQGFFELLDAVYATGRPYVATAAAVDLRRGEDGPIERRYLDFIYQPIVDGFGKVTGIFAEGHDVTEQTLAAEHRQLLVNELNHRVKNTLATVQSLAHQTLRNAASLPEAAQTLTARLVSLSRAHDVLTRENWAGAEVSEIVAEAMRPHEEPGRARVTAGGRAVRLGARAALALSMALHELATNAAKYGALSNEQGAVAIRWTMVEPDHVQIEWRETGGPPILETPRRQGFGSRLMSSGLAVELGAAAEIDFAPTGVVCRILAPVADAPVAKPEPPESRGRQKARARRPRDLLRAPTP